MTRLPGKLLLAVAVLSGCILMASLVFAGSTGKIKGVVTDKATGEPIPGASVQILGTKQGAMTDS